MANKTEEFWGRGRVQMDFLRNPFDADAHHVPVHAGDYMLYFGRLIDEKGVDVLVEAARSAPGVPVVIVGEGPDRDKLERAAASLENVRVVGPAWGADLKAWLHGARAVVVPSLWHENFSDKATSPTPALWQRRWSMWISNPYGPRQGHGGVQGVIGTFLWRIAQGERIQIWGDGSVIRNFVHINDLAELCARCAQQSVAGIFNAGSGQGASISEVLDVIRTVTGKPVQPDYKPGRGFDVPRVVLDISAIQERVSWAPAISLDDGIERTWESGVRQLIA